jgi:prepilin-type N-terminal cleavage/methylation domain-containing protein
MKKIIKGFTLLELLIVIGIIGVLVALATVSYSSAQKSSRDSRRKQDMVAIQNAMEQYYSATSFVYPNPCSGASTYLRSAWPTDPAGGAYTQISCSASSYCICANMEKLTGGNSNDASCTSWNNNSTGPLYCVANLQ